MNDAKECGDTEAGFAPTLQDKVMNKPVTKTPHSDSRHTGVAAHAA